ncbi:MAG: sugar kinase [Runella slithyformis]|nr:MAG: sugar kinase [Runella slithyformis]TAF24709.1 MAG: sugar kinase [Runella slithyformis]TAF49569.1 MAG: sugar kinase [Runella slithyformis]TAF79376.1 MAG: sugar kinase [Runella slithyformis]
MQKIVTFGQIMMRLSPPAFARFGQAHSFDITYAGGEANVAIALAQWGVAAVHVTRFPDNDMGRAATMYLRKFGLDTAQIQYGGERLGLYFVENGANSRASQVVYDRLNDSFCTLNPAHFDWEAILTGASWFHFTGIAPALSEAAAEACLEAVRTAKRLGVKISADVNYRQGLWRWGKTPKEIMPELVSHCDLIVCGTSNAEDLFDILPEPDAKSNWASASAQVMERYPSVKTIVDTKRDSISASHNQLRGRAFDGTKTYKTIVHDLHHIVDRIGSGDAFIAGYLYQIDQTNDVQKALDFGTAAAALKHTIEGDFNLVSVAEVSRLVAGDASGRLSR